MIGLFAFSSLLVQAAPKDYASFSDYPTPKGSLTEMTYSPERTEFKLWAPTASEVQLRLYENGSGGEAVQTKRMKRASDGTWRVTLGGNLEGKFYTFQVKIGKEWRKETPGINARAVGVNGGRAAIVDLATTHPAGWENDRAPKHDDVVIYEMHHRDFSISLSSGVKHRGKFLALTESGTKTAYGVPTGLDHLKDLGVTHVHILPSYDYASIDETAIDRPHYNWGYDPLNYNVPEGSYSTDPADPKARIREFKQMVKALHDNGLKVVLDVVYNHTFDIENSNFERTVPGYFYRQRPDGTYADASACGNETASEREVMRRYMVESVEYWMKEYHIDGFRFDLMGIHDIETMRQIRAAAERINPDVLIYGEGWAARAPQLADGDAAMKAEVHRIPGVAAFSDEMRDGLRGPFSDDKQTAFLGGLHGHEESIKFGIAGAIRHPQVDYTKVNYTNAPWAAQPQQMISYVSCHDDMCLHDRLRASIPGVTNEEVRRLALLAQTAVLTSQGTPFIFAGEEVNRSKKMVHNSYKSPDSINEINWLNKVAFADDYAYLRELIHLRKAHPAFRLRDADLVRRHLEFLSSPAGTVAYRLKEHAGGDRWKEILVVLNGQQSAQTLALPAHDYRLHLSSRKDVKIETNNGFLRGTVSVPAQTALILYAE